MITNYHDKKFSQSPVTPASAIAAKQLSAYPNIIPDREMSKFLYSRTIGFDAMLDAS